ncbi:CRHR2 [Mytilus edulis]|uniref:CRHR2 n=1 Tax=Mytilus edulis TaxID=6550 RepID=A0A8S3PW26_MYTED|nr:CRHR2 [Mytilus edulis]
MDYEHMMMEFEGRAPYKLACLQRQQQYHETYVDNGNSYCNMTWDGLSCWPASLVGEFAIIQCPQDMQGVDSTQNASRLCTTNGTWALKSDYNSCLTDTNPKDLYNGVESVHEYSRRIIYNLGFIVSTITLIIALFIFLYFRSLRCLRNIIHSHLIATFILRNLLWIMMQHTLWPIVQADEKWACKLEVALFNYAQMTNFFWMLVEGLYLHIIIVWTYSADKIRKWYFIIIGWFVPAVIIAIWVILRTQVTADETSDVAACFMPKSKNYAESEADKLDYIYIAPILFVLAMEVAFDSVAAMDLSFTKDKKSSCYIILKKKLKIFQDTRALSTRYTKTSMVQDMSVVGRDSIAPTNGKLTSGRNGFRFMSNSQRFNDDEQAESENML